MRFTGSIDAKVDEKGRVFVPSSFRKILQREDAAGLVLRRDVFQRCLVLYPGCRGSFGRTGVAGRQSGEDDETAGLTSRCAPLCPTENERLRHEL